MDGNAGTRWSGASIQSSVDNVFDQMQSNQFGSQRYAVLFKLGSYSGFNAQIGFYTSIAGLGRNPDDDVQIHGGAVQGTATVPVIVVSYS